MACRRVAVPSPTTWVATLVAPEDLSAAVAHLDLDGLPAPGRDSRGGDAAGWVLRLWERLAGLLAHRGVALPEGRSGLQRLSPLAGAPSSR